VPVKIMDEYIMEAFLNALKIGVSSKDLPLDGSKFYQNHMLLCKRDNVMLDLKNSSHKKIGKFFTNMAKLGKHK
jgi:translation initiation factor 2D